MRLWVWTRHAESTLNVAGRVNGDPAVPAPLSPAGREAAARLGQQLAQLPLDLCVHTRFQRTRETAELALVGRDVPLAVEPLLDDVDVGDLDGDTLEAYRAWKAAHARGDRFPGGESLDDAALRYARGVRALLARAQTCVLVVCHEIPIRYVLNAAAGSPQLDGPVHAIGNALPYLLDDGALGRAAERLELLAAGRAHGRGGE